MPIAQVEYVGFKNNEASREYSLRIRHKDGHCDEFVVAIPLEAFVAHRVRYQDGAEICFQKLQRAVEGWEAESETLFPSTRLDVTNAEMEAFKVSQAPKARTRRAPPVPQP
jgi:hypothetical protein